MIIFQDPIYNFFQVMEFPVTKDTKCTQNKAFVRWHDSPLKMYGVRFAKESQANQVGNHEL